MSPPRISTMSYLLGVVTASAIFAIAVAFVGVRSGGRQTWRLVTSAFSTSSPEEVALAEDAPPDQLWAEMTRLGAVPDNMANVSGAKPHDNFLVRPHQVLGWVLRPNVTGVAYLLASKQDLNFDPPVLYLPADAVASPELAAYLKRAARVESRFSTTSDGRRTTLPVVSSPRRVLVIGDSVAFGLGVADDQTIPSHLQRLAGSALQVVNAAVGGYDAAQIREVARREAQARTYDALIYVACLNDFDDSSNEAYLASAGGLLRELATLRPRFSDHVAVILQSHLDYVARDVFGARGWSPDELARMDYLIAGLPGIARELGINYVDWADRMRAVTRDQGTAFGRFAFYYDHVHFSPAGNRLAAEELAAILRTWHLVR